MCRSNKCDNRLQLLPCLSQRDRPLHFEGLPGVIQFVHLPAVLMAVLNLSVSCLLLQWLLCRHIYFVKYYCTSLVPRLHSIDFSQNANMEREREREREWLGWNADQSTSLMWCSALLDEITVMLVRKLSVFCQIQANWSTLQSYLRNFWLCILWS